MSPCPNASLALRIAEARAVSSGAFVAPGAPAGGALVRAAGGAISFPGADSIVALSAGGAGREAGTAACAAWAVWSVIAKSAARATPRGPGNRERRFMRASSLARAPPRATPPRRGRARAASGAEPGPAPGPAVLASCHAPIRRPAPAGPRRRRHGHRRSPVRTPLPPAGACPRPAPPRADGRARHEPHVHAPRRRAAAPDRERPPPWEAPGVRHRALPVRALLAGESPEGQRRRG